VSKYLCSLTPGESVEVKGPFKKLTYSANMKRNIGMIAGGSGITPCLQVLKESLSLAEDMTQFTLIYANRAEEDILLREELQELAAQSGGRISVHYVTEVAGGDPAVEHVGYVTADLARRLLPPPAADTLVYVCGPPPMMVAVSGNKVFEQGKPPAQGPVSGVLKALGYTEDQVYKF
jgi:cytochrome-b5 reductase